MSATDGLAVEAQLENKAMCFSLHGYDLQHKGLHGVLSIGFISVLSILYVGSISLLLGIPLHR
jgi:hypothetical protein